MSELMAEVDEALKRERLEYIWKNYGNILIGAVLCVVLGTGAYSAYSGWRASHTAAQTEKLIAAEALNDPAQSITAAETLDSGLRSIALLRAAAAFMERGDKTQAIAAYDKVASLAEAPSEFKTLAAFMAAQLQSESDPAKALSAFEAMAGMADNPYRYHARLEAALIEAHINKNYDAAIKQLDVLINAKDIPPSLNAKANALTVVYGLRQKK